MKTALQGKGRSAGYARDRMKMLLVSERIDCSPQMMKMLKNDMIHTVKKYVKTLLQKTGFTTRTQLAVMARESGIVIRGF